MNERGRALGSIGAFVSLGSIAGPGLGGLILSQFSWPYIFWINVPVGIITMIAGTKFLPKDITMTKKKIDKLGFLSFASFIVTFFGAVFIGQEEGFLHVVPVTLFILALISFVLFILIEKKVKIPLIAFSIFKNKIFTLSLISAVIIFSSNFFVNVVIPFYLQKARGLGPSQAGILMMIFPLVMVIGSPLSGYLTDKIGPTKLVLTGLSLLSITQLMYMFMDVQTPLWYYVIATAIMGLGNSLFQSPNNMLVMSSVAKEDLGVASSMNAFARNLGMVIGIALSTTVLYAAMSQKMGEKVTTYLNERPDVFVYGMKITFLCSLLLCLFSLIVTVWRIRKNPAN
jgi:MFS family permease